MTIERIEPGTAAWTAYYANHIHRYMFALDQIDRQTPALLLDAACGVGYGSNYLASGSQCQVVGVDVSTHALKIANGRFRMAQTEFILDDCCRLEKVSGKGPFDYVISFETLEHLSQPLEFLQLVQKLMRSGGKLIISTPNINVSSPDGNVRWDFHEKEYTAAEFYALLESAGFRDIQLFGQQLNLRGKLKSEVRGDLHQLWSNPFVRAGRWIQRVARGRRFDPVLKETTDDFEIVQFNHPAACDELKMNGPFVLIGVAVK